MGKDSRAELVTEVLKEINLEIAMCQQDKVEGALAAISMFPPNLPATWFNEMLSLQAE